jgi:hypothetical protein
MKRRLPRLFNDETSVLIGITDEDMCIRELGPSSMYNHYEVRGRFGVVSIYLLRYRRENISSVRTRVQKLITRDIGVMAFQLPRISDPTSVLAINIGPVSNIDLVVESFEGLGPRAVVDEYRRAHGETSYEPELLPDISKQGLSDRFESLSVSDDEKETDRWSISSQFRRVDRRMCAEEFSQFQC